MRVKKWVNQGRSAAPLRHPFSGILEQDRARPGQLSPAKAETMGQYSSKTSQEKLGVLSEK